MDGLQEKRSEAAERNKLIQAANHTAAAEKAAKVAAEEARTKELLHASRDVDKFTPEQVAFCFDRLAADMQIDQGGTPMKDATKRSILKQGIQGGWSLPLDMPGIPTPAAPPTSAPASAQTAISANLSPELVPEPESAISHTSTIGHAKHFGLVDDNYVVCEALDWIEKNSMNEEGVWRRECDPSLVDDAMLSFERNLPPNFGKDSSVATGLVLRWLHLLPEGLLHSHLSDMLIICGRNLDAIKKQLVQGLSEAQLKTLALLAVHWQRVANSQANHMDANSMAVCVFSALARSSQAMHIMPRLIGPVSEIIANATEIFRDVVTTDIGGHTLPNAIRKWAALRGVVRTTFSLERISQALSTSKAAAQRCSTSANQAASPLASPLKRKPTYMASPKLPQPWSSLSNNSVGPDSLVQPTGTIPWDPFVGNHASQLIEQILAWSQNESDLASYQAQHVLSKSSTAIQQFVSDCCFALMGDAAHPLYLIQHALSSITGSGIQGMAAGLQDTMAKRQYECVTNPSKRTVASAMSLARIQVQILALRKFEKLRTSILNEFHDRMMRDLIVNGITGCRAMSVLKMVDVDNLAAYLQDQIHQFNTEVIEFNQWVNSSAYSNPHVTTEETRLTRSAKIRETLRQKAVREDVCTRLNEYIKQRNRNNWLSPQELEELQRETSAREEENSPQGAPGKGKVPGSQSRSSTGSPTQWSGFREHVLLGAQIQQYARQLKEQLRLSLSDALVKAWEGAAAEPSKLDSARGDISSQVIFGLLK